MPQNSPPIIADGTSPLAGRITGLAAAAIGAAAAIFYAGQNLTLSHYDARAHLVVARRIVDSLTPGWRQIGAVWLPAPHLLNLIPIQSNWAFQTGYPSVALSVLALAAGLAALGRYLGRHTGSPLVALAVPLAILVNPDVLYLQSTPMTEPLLFGAALLSLDAVDQWVRTPDERHRRRAGWWLVLLVLTRYEGWFIASALVGLTVLTRPGLMRRGVVLAAYPAIAILGFLVLSRVTVGEWFVSSGFFVPENPSLHHPVAAAAEVVNGTVTLAGWAVALAGGLGLVGLAALAWRSASALLPTATLAAGLLPFAAFYEGHPHRIRYMVPLVVACGVVAGAGIAVLPRRLRGAAASALLAAALLTRPPLDLQAPMVLEAQRESPARAGRRVVTAYLASRWDHTPILASMGSLGHYMQETASIGVNLRDFVHEGNGDLWAMALAAPDRYVRWVLVEERAEGGDLLAERARRDPAFLARFDRVAEGGGLALYRLRNGS